MSSQTTKGMWFIRPIKDKGCLKNTYGTVVKGILFKGLALIFWLSYLVVMGPWNVVSIEIGFTQPFKGLFSLAKISHFVSHSCEGKITQL